MTHLDEEAVLSRARGERLHPAMLAHARECAHCQRRVAAWTNVASAARQLEARDTAVVVPSFDRLLGPALATSAASGVEVVAPSPRRSWRISLALAGWQLRLLPRSLAVLTLLGLGLGIAAAAAVSEPVWAARVFADVMVLLALMGAIGIVGERVDPRGELWRALPVSPGAVLLSRVTVVVGFDLLAATAASAVLAATTSAGSFSALVAAWLGPALLSAGVALLGTVWRGGWLGGALGAAVWVLGTMSTLPMAHTVDAGMGAVATRLWATTPATVAAGVLLLALAVAVGARSGERRLSLA